MRKLSQIYILIEIFIKFDAKLDCGLTWWIVAITLTSFFCFWKNILAAIIFDICSAPEMLLHSLCTSSPKSFV